MENGHPGCSFADFTKAPACLNSPLEPELGRKISLLNISLLILHSAQAAVCNIPTMIFHEQIYIYIVH